MATAHKTRKLESGQIVPVYFDQDTKQKFEGRFELIEKTFENKEIEIWICNNVAAPTGLPGQRIFFKNIAATLYIHPTKKKAKKFIAERINPIPATQRLKSANSFSRYLLEQRKFTDEEIFKQVSKLFPKFQQRYVGIKRSDLNREKYQNNPIIKKVENK